MAEQVPADWRNKVMHGSLAVGEQVLMGGDVTPDRYEKPQGFSLSLHINGTAEAERIFHALAKDGTVLDRSVRHAHRSVRHTVAG